MIVCIVSDEDGDDILKYESRDGELLFGLASRVCTDISERFPDENLFWRFRRVEQPKELWVPPKWENHVPLHDRMSWSKDSEGIQV